MSFNNTSAQKTPSQDYQPLYRQLIQKVIHVVESDKKMRTLIKSILREGNFNVVESVNATDALSKLARHPEIDLGIINLNMPKLNGIQFLNIVQRQANYAKTPYIVMSETTSPETVIHCIKAGAKDYVVKPIEKNILFQKICTLLESRDQSMQPQFL